MKELYPKVYIKFSWEGFVKVNLLELLSQVGYSKSEARRLFRDKAVLVTDTRLTNDKSQMISYRRVANPTELLEPDDLIYVGKRRVITIKAKPFTWYERLYYRCRDVRDKLLDVKCKGHYLFLKV